MKQWEVLILGNPKRNENYLSEKGELLIRSNVDIFLNKSTQ